MAIYGEESKAIYEHIRWFDDEDESTYWTAYLINLKGYKLIMPICKNGTYGIRYLSHHKYALYGNRDTGIIKEIEGKIYEPTYRYEEIVLEEFKKIRHYPLRVIYDDYDVIILEKEENEYAIHTSFDLRLKNRWLQCN